MDCSRQLVTAFLVLAVASAVAPCRAEGVRPLHLYNLADFRGTVPYNHVNLFVDRDAEEVYVADRNVVQVFNATGMEIYRFEADPQLGAIYDLAVDENGDMLFLSWESIAPGNRQFFITRCDYRGQPKERITVGSLPPEFAEFRPNEMTYRDGHFFLVSKNQLRAAVVDPDGVFERGYEFAELLGLEPEELDDAAISGFNVDDAGNILLTLPALFRALVLSPQGKVIGSLGRSGSGPGTFGIAAGIAADGRGNYLVAEKLRSVVMVFDSNFNFVTEFGRYGHGPDNLVIPHELAMGNEGRLYVTQLLNRGVSVFSLKVESTD